MTEEEDPGVEDGVNAVWMQAITSEWREEMADPREDIYTMEDGEPLDAAR